MDVQLGHRFLAGLAVTAETPIEGKDRELFGRSLAFGAHLGYGW